MEYIKEYIKNDTRTEYALNFIIKKIEPILSKKEPSIYIDSKIYTVLSTSGDKQYKKIEISFNMNDEEYSNKFFGTKDGLLFLQKILDRYKNKFLKEDIIVSTIRGYKVLRNTFYIIAKDISGNRVYPPKYVYHVTKKENVDSILKNGLIPNDNTILKKDNNKSYKEYKWIGHLHYPAACFVTTNIESDIYKRVGFGNVVIKINTTKCNNKFYYDLNQEYSEEKNWLMTFEPISNKAIEDNYVEDNYMKENVDYDYSDIFEQIDMFLLLKKRNTWIQTDHINIYIRNSKRYVNNDVLDFFDIANIEVYEEYQNNGYFTKFIEKFLKKYHEKNIYVESIINPVIEHILKKFNFKYLTNSEFNVNMYKLSEK